MQGVEDAGGTAVSYVSVDVAAGSAQCWEDLMNYSPHGTITRYSVRSKSYSVNNCSAPPEVKLYSERSRVSKPQTTSSSQVVKSVLHDSDKGVRHEKSDDFNM